MAQIRPLPRILSVSEYLTDEIKINVNKRLIDFHFPTHGHEFYEIELVTDGVAKYTVNGKTFKLEKGSLYFVTPADIHHVDVMDGSNATVINVQFDEKSVEPSLMLNFIKSGREKTIKLNGDDWIYAINLFELLLSEHDGNGDYRNICLKNYLENILVFFLRQNLDEDLTQIKDNRSMSKAVIYVHSKFRDGISLKEASDFCGFTPSYFSVKFHDYTGVTFKEYVDRLKISYAENLLRSTDMSITEVCFNSGYKNVSSFIRRFYCKNGISPAKFRVTMGNL